MSSAALPLSAEDLSILALENETVAGHTCKVVVLEKAIDVDELREKIASRLELAPELRMRLGERDGGLCWIPDPDLDLAQHIQASESADADLCTTVARLFEQRLDRARPLWRLDVASVSDRRYALIWRIHHALADGSTVISASACSAASPTESGPETAMPMGGGCSGRSYSLARSTWKCLPE